jgi:hypothetical protein
VGFERSLGTTVAVLNQKTETIIFEYHQIFEREKWKILNDGCIFGEREKSEGINARHQPP